MKIQHTKSTEKKLAALAAKPNELAAVVRADDGYVYKVLPLEQAIKVCALRIATWHRPFVVAVTG
jgi:hypothetical protein